MRCPRSRGSLALIFWALGGPTPAQEVIGDTEQLESSRPEAWAMNYFTSIALLSGLSVPHGRAPGAVEVGVELGWIPALSRAERRVGFDGIKEEDLNQAPLFARPRLTLALPQRFAVTLSYLPPVKVFDLKPHLLAVAVERPLYERNVWTMGLRLYGQVGKVQGAITCGRDVARFEPGTPGNLFGCEAPSADEATQRYVGLELSGAYRIPRLDGLTSYLTLAANFLDTEVRVDAQTFGFHDRTRLRAETWTFAAGAGIICPLADRLSVSVGVFYSPLTVQRPPAESSENDALLNVRALLSYALW